MQKESDGPKAAKVKVQNLYTLKQVVRAGSPVQSDTEAVKPGRVRKGCKRIKDLSMWCSRLNVDVTSSSVLSFVNGEFLCGL